MCTGWLNGARSQSRYLKSSDILQGQALFKRVKQLLTWGVWHQFLTIIFLFLKNTFSYKLHFFWIVDFSIVFFNFLKYQLLFWKIHIFILMFVLTLNLDRQKKGQKEGQTDRRTVWQSEEHTYQQKDKQTERRKLRDITEGKSLPPYIQSYKAELAIIFNQGKTNTNTNFKISHVIEIWFWAFWDIETIMS